MEKLLAQSQSQAEEAQRGRDLALLQAQEQEVQLHPTVTPQSNTPILHWAVLFSVYCILFK